MWLFCLSTQEWAAVALPAPIVHGKPRPAPLLTLRGEGEFQLLKLRDAVGEHAVCNTCKPFSRLRLLVEF